MTTSEVANKLVDLCRKGQNLEAITTLYSPGIVSVEASGPPEMLEVKGLDAVLGKSKWWMDNHEVHGATVEGPMVAGNQFGVGFKMDVTNKPSGKRFTMEELGVYHVKDGKVVREQFFY
jgi:SnoaL-like domain